VLTASGLTIPAHTRLFTLPRSAARNLLTPPAARLRSPDHHGDHHCNQRIPLDEQLDDVQLEEQLEVPDDDLSS
jgi:hypothetical protein